MIGDEFRFRSLPGINLALRKINRFGFSLIKFNLTSFEIRVDAFDRTFEFASNHLGTLMTVVRTGVIGKLGQVTPFGDFQVRYVNIIQQRRQRAALRKTSSNIVQTGL